MPLDMKIFYLYWQKNLNLIFFGTLIQTSSLALCKISNFPLRKRQDRKNYGCLRKNSLCSTKYWFKIFMTASIKEFWFQIISF